MLRSWLPAFVVCSIFWRFRRGPADLQTDHRPNADYDAVDDTDGNELNARSWPPIDLNEDGAVFDDGDDGDDILDDDDDHDDDHDFQGDDVDSEFCEQSSFPDPGSDSWPDVAESDNLSLSHDKRQLSDNFPPPRQKSSREDCRSTAGPRDDPEFFQSVRPCGFWRARCDDLPVVVANRDYPGGGAYGAVSPGQDYIVQFDIGLHPEVARDVLQRYFRQIDSCLNCPKHGETCLEAVVTGGAMWGNLGVPGVQRKAYNCMGGCGRGCAAIRLLKSQDDIGALDCLKHDLCSAWKSAKTGMAAQGFCHDPDCGDEAAMSIFNCWKGWRMFGAVGGNRDGPFATPHVCDNTTAGCWSHGGWFTTGRCKIFQGWHKGQGIPDRRSPIR